MHIMESDGNTEINPSKDNASLSKQDVLNLCRLCANAHNNLWPIFSGEGLANNISEKLERYLPIIEVAESDTLPSQICYQCATVLIRWHHWYEGCSVADQRLRGTFTSDEKISKDEPSENYDDFLDDVHINVMALDENENANSEMETEKGIEEDRNNLDENTNETKETSRSIARVEMKRGEVFPSNDVEGTPTERSSKPSNKNSTKLNSQPAGWSNILRQSALKMAISVPKPRSILPRASVPHIPVTKTDLNLMTTASRLIKVLPLVPVSIISVASSNVEDQAPTEAKKVDGYQCNLCSAVLRCKTDLNRHMQCSHKSSDSNLLDNSSSSMHFCYYCDYRCKRKYDIKRHILSMHLKNLPTSDKKMECSICDLSFQDVTTLCEHVMKLHCDAKNVTDEEKKSNDRLNSADNGNKRKVILKMHPCGICKASYTRKSDFYRHLRNKHPTELDSHGEKILLRKRAAVNCPYCDETAVNINFILSHIKSAHNIDTSTPFICVPCNKTFNRKTTLNTHSETYHPRELSPEETDRILKTAEILLNGDKAFHCDICSRNIVDPVRFVAHYRLHNVERKFICDLCGKQTRTKYQLNSHINSIHLDIRPFQCDRCLKSFKTRQSHDEHYRIHTGERPFSCEKCGKTFIALNALLTHQKFHNDFFAHKCPICPKKFKIRRQLTLHVYTHTKERPYQCDLCPKTFYNSSRFSYHKKVTHSDNRPFMCSQCGSCFKANKFLQRHLKLHKKRAQIQFRRRNNPAYFEAQKAGSTENSQGGREIVGPSRDNREDTIDLAVDERVQEEMDTEMVENEDTRIIE